jgi:hypothetical protein
MSNDIDSRAREAAAALHRAVDTIDAPEAVRTPRRPRTPFLLAAAAVLVVVAVAAALLASGDDADDRDITAAGGGLQPLVARVLPGGVELAGGFDLPAGGSEQAPELWLYGAGSGGDPFADGVVAAFASTEDLPVEDIGGEQVSVGSYDGVIDDLDQQRRLRAQVGDQVVTLLSWTHDDRALVDAATELFANGIPADAPDRVGDLDLVAAVHPAGGLAMPTVAGARGHATRYQSDDGRGIFVTAVDNTDAGWAVVRWALGAEPERVSVDGHDALIAQPYDDDTSATIAWRDGAAIVLVSTFGLDRAALIAAAESLEPASNDEWAAAKDAVPPRGDADVPDDARASVGPIDAPSGASVAAYVGGDGSLCADVVTDDSSSGTCSASAVGDPPPPLTAHDNGGTAVAVAGLAPAATADIQGGEGWEVVGLTPVPDSGGSLLYLIVGATEPLPAEVIFLRADGTEIGRAPLDG